MSKAHNYNYVNIIIIMFLHNYNYVLLTVLYRVKRLKRFKSVSSQRSDRGNERRLDSAFDINCLPDKLLLYILSFLSPSDLLKAAQVCRRWRYLSAFDDVWIVKCLEFGEDEGVENMPQLIKSANTGGKSVDWQLAYVELHRLVATWKKTNLQPSISDAAISLKTSESDTGCKLNRPTNQSTIKQTETKGEKTWDVGSPAKDLPPMVHAPDDLKCRLQATDHIPKLSDKHHVSLKSSQKSMKVLLPEKSGRSSADAARAKSSQKGSRLLTVQGGKEAEETVLDILTDLTQSTDLLGKIQPSMSLEWRTPQHDDDLIRFPVYAGKVAIVQKVHKITGHAGGINCLQFDQRRLFTGGADRTVRLWDIRSGRPVHQFYGHKGGVRCLQFDDDILVTGAWDTVILVWNIRKFTQTAILHGHEDSVSCLKLLSHLLISGSHDRTVRLWSRATYDCTKVLHGHAGPVLSLESDGTFVYSSSADMTIRMTELRSGLCKRVLERANTSPINCLKMHGLLVLGGEVEGKVCFWNTVTGEAEAAVRAHDFAINALDYRHGRFYTGSSDGTISEYDLMTMTCLRVLRGHTGPVRAVQVSERRFVSCGDDGSVRIWDFHTSTGSHLPSAR